MLLNRIVNVSVTIRLPKTVVEQIDALVAQGYYPSRSEFVREAIRKHLLEVLQKLQPQHVAEN